MREEAVYPFLTGYVKITCEDGFVTRIDRVEGPARGGGETGLPALAYKELSEYARGERKAFDLPLRFCGTPFQERVWRALCGIPYGETRSYGDIARAVGSPGAARAVGQANHVNPLSIIVPCHRVISADGSLGGYGGGLEMKKTLLELEKKNK